VACLLVASGNALAQSQMTPGAPSVPLLAPALANGVQNRITYQYGTEFVTIGAAGNNNWNPPPQFTDSMRGHGGIGYEYRIGRTEITTSQWVAFMNAAYGRSDSIPWISIPSTWGAAADPTYSGPGRRWIAQTAVDTLLRRVAGEAGGPDEAAASPASGRGPFPSAASAIAPAPGPRLAEEAKIHKAAKEVQMI
jgi:hypothetical protein